MDEDVILITFEFRLGILGHFSTGTSEYPGNIGARDRIMALKWVQENIEAFGGDPKKVLIFGNSSGAHCMHELVYSPMGEGLFSRAIMQSGSSLSASYVLRDVVSNIRNVTEELGCGNNWDSTRRLLRCLRRLNATDIVLNPLQPYFDGVSIEPLPEDGDTANVYLQDTPWSRIQKGGSHRVPAIFGVNSLEAIDPGLLEVLFTPNGPKIIQQRWNELVPSIVGVPDDENLTMSSEFYDVYIGPEGVSRDSAMGLWNLSSDGVHHSSRVSGMLHATTTGEPVYFYYLSKEPPKSYGSKAKELYPAHGASHADELQYLFLYYGYPEITIDSPWFKFSETLVHMWTSFAATGKPESPAGNWEPIALADNGMKWYQLDDEMKTIEPFTRRMEAWDEFIPRLYINAQE
jgi:carboxylesterase type B